MLEAALIGVEALKTKIVKGTLQICCPNGFIVLPQVWERVIRPGWLVELRSAQAKAAGEVQNKHADEVEKEPIGTNKHANEMVKESDGRILPTAKPLRDIVEDMKAEQPTTPLPAKWTKSEFERRSSVASDDSVVNVVEVEE